jgi:predicted AAA+ superfamily ATPase
VGREGKEVRRYFASNDPGHILGELSLFLGREIRPERALLFLDEIQAAGEIVAKLRWFHEEMPALPIVAAGSLLEFTLADHDFSMPVSRVTFRHIQPMTFSEYLVAAGRTSLAETLAAWRPGEELSAAAHDAAMTAFDRFAMAGGMPEAVRTDIEGASARALREVQRDLVATYRADFAKYSGRMKSDILDATLLAVSAPIGEKFTYSRTGHGVKHQQAKKALELLSRARLCHIVRRTTANGLPLGGEVSERSCKAILGDVGVFHALVGAQRRRGSGQARRADRGGERA